MVGCRTVGGESSSTVTIAHGETITSSIHTKSTCICEWYINGVVGSAVDGTLHDHELMVNVPRQRRRGYVSCGDVRITVQIVQSEMSIFGTTNERVGMLLRGAPQMARHNVTGALERREWNVWSPVIP